ncbi:carboxysome shell protein [Synechococcus sp. RSCCF101]|uniref:carboxysome assembly protein CsoS2 n=1 Tax=Synechococcus sp. RSCCF101 TaxID=2511069 RepID=UPI0012444587|nr:CsoS2 family carboxysome shell protein [Synechococcus sp. RSCCF101]QEY31338.1 carboxysome shell protein [Synechococcus sp. RSCCF101]
MARTSSREAALERRKALTTAGKKAAGRYTSSPERVRGAADARPSRTKAAAVTPRETRPSTPRTRAAAPAPAPVSLPRQESTSRTLQRIPNPSRDLVLARREALSRRGKRADGSRDRTRVDVHQASRQAAAQAPAPTPAAAPATPARPAASARSLQPADIQRRNVKRRAIENPSRSLVLARRQALSKHGKSASQSSPTPASMARQANPDLTSRELAQRVRELRSRSGACGSQRSGGTRPTGPRRGINRPTEAADAHWKVGASETSTGQTVTGTQANRSPRTTGNEASTCRTITGTQYMGAEIFRDFCQAEPEPSQPLKVQVTSTSHGNRVTGNEVGRSHKVTGDEPGTCKNVTGTEYIGADQMTSWCGGSIPSNPKVGLSRTEAGRPVTGVMVGRSERVTGDEAGSARTLTGDQYLGRDPLPGGRPAEKVGNLQTLRGAGVTGTMVGRSPHVTGNEPGSCKRVTGDEYVGPQQYEAFCGARPQPEAAKVGFSVTNRSQVVSGTQTGRSGRVTGDEPGTCKAVTGTPYAGLEQAGAWCGKEQVESIRQRTPVGAGTPGPGLTGLQPGLGGVMTGADRGACEPISGTPYVGPEHIGEACGASTDNAADFPQPLADAPWQRFSVQSPARAAQVERQRSRAVTGNRYEQGSRITGPFDMAPDKVTGTEQFRFDRPGRQPRALPARPEPAGAGPALAGQHDVGAVRTSPKVTGEGSSTAHRITGDDWDRGQHVTGTEGASARRRNPSRPGPMTAMPAFEPKRNRDRDQPVSPITGSSGNTEKGSLVTLSGGARG